MAGSDQNQNKNPAYKEGSEEYTTYFMNNIVLNRDGVSPHAQRVWNKMKSDGLKPGESIDQYVSTFVKSYNQKAEQFNAKHKAERDIMPQTLLTMQDQNRLTEQLVDEVKDLLYIEEAVHKVQPTPGLIADTFIETRVLPEMHSGTRDVIIQMNNDPDLDLDDAIEKYFEGREKIFLAQNMAGAPVPMQNFEEYGPVSDLEKARNSATGGVGLGLPIAQDIVHSHGGEITLMKSDHGGLRVFIRLPV